jgi:MscS family membrane protein
MDTLNWLKTTSLANTQAWRILLFFVSILAALLAGKIAGIVLRKSAGRLESDGRVVIAAAFEAAAASLGFLIFTIGARIGLGFLKMGPAVSGAAGSALSALFIISITWIAYRMVAVAEKALARIASGSESRMNDMMIPLVRKSLRVTIVVLGLLQLATTLSDKPVTSLLAGLGVGGLAVALAAQDTLKNLFGSLVIFSDKPFELGDRIVVDGHDGNVAEVGFRSTRIRTLEGHLVTIPNAELANKTLLNIGKRPHIRRTMNIGLTYSTTPEKMRRAMEIIRELLENHEGMDPEFPPRVVFNEFKDFSLNILVIYWYHPPAYWDFMAFSENLNMEILSRFKAEGIEFAFPSQTIYLS